MPSADFHKISLQYEKVAETPYWHVPSQKALTEIK